MVIKPFNVIQGHQFWLWPIIIRIVAIDRGVPHFNDPASDDPLRISG